MEQTLPTTFEQERDDLLAQYEASPAFRPAGDYTPDQFDGRCRTYLPKLKALLEVYTQAYPHFRDVLGLELSRPRRASAGNGPVAYEFDGLMLPERLARRVGRLKLPVGAALFSAFNPVYSTDKSAVMLQQRSHFKWALTIVGQLAGATTRELLTFPLPSQSMSKVVSALQRLRAFGPDDGQLLKAVGEVPGLGHWWERCGLTLNRGDLRVATRADHLASFETYDQQNVPELSVESGQQLVAAATLARQAGQCPHGFSAAFYWRYFTCTVVPAEFHAPATRVGASVSVLYQLRDYADKRTEKSAKPEKETLHLLEQLTATFSSASHSLAAIFFAELGQQLQGVPAAERLQRHLALSCLSKHPSLIHSFYQAIGTYLDVQDIEEHEQADYLLELAQAMDATASLRPGREELALCAAAICQQLYTGLDLSKPTDQRTLQRLYVLLVHCLDATELDTLEELVLEQLIEHPAHAGQWLAEDGTLAYRLRHHLRQQLLTSATLFGDVTYERIVQLLIAFTPPIEISLNQPVLARRYDVRYFLRAT